ncbi:FMRFamide receptor-like [Lineus longissimus]|uniref:FMRFamide receptor-like n=1 Tax=Lineus longissimus TaxID=88925 RepID=UPI00315DA12C
MATAFKDFNSTEYALDIIPHEKIITPTAQSSTTSFDDFMWINFWEWRVQVILWIYVPPILIVMGTFFNGLTVLVLLQRKFGKPSTRLLLIVLALADTSMLLTRCLRWWILKAFAIDVRYLSAASCPIHLFFTYFLFHFASWNVALLTLERWISVSYPLKARVICTRKNIIITLTITITFLVALNSHIFYFFQRTHDSNCKYISKAYHNFLLKVWYWIDFLAYSGLPFTVITFCNCSIFHQVSQGQTRRKALQNSDGKTDCGRAQMTSMTRMLTTVSVMFILFTLPVSVYFIVYGYLPGRDTRTRKQWAQYDLSYAATNLFSYLNNTVNFILYCLSGTQFRREVLRMLRCQRVVEASQGSGSQDKTSVT